MLVKDADDNSRVGHARNLDIVQIIFDSESLFKSKYQRVDTGASRVDQGAVDIEKEQAFLRFCHTKNDEIRMTNDKGMTKVKSRIFVSKGAALQVLSFEFFSASDIRASSLAFEITRPATLLRPNSSKARGMHH
jgi:hypothetical protein